MKRIDDVLVTSVPFCGRVVAKVAFCVSEFFIESLVVSVRDRGSRDPGAVAAVANEYIGRVDLRERNVTEGDPPGGALVTVVRFPILSPRVKVTVSDLFSMVKVSFIFDGAILFVLVCLSGPGGSVLCLGLSLTPFD